MVQVKKGHDDFIVYQEGDFSNHHAHVKNQSVAHMLRRNVNNGIIPKSTDLHLLESHLRVAKDIDYRKAILDRISEVSERKDRKSRNLELLFNYKKLPLLEDPAPILLAIQVIQNTYYQPTTILSNGPSITLYYQLDDGIKFDITLYANHQVDCYYNGNSYSFKMTYGQCCHMVKAIATNKFKVGDYRLWES